MLCSLFLCFQTEQTEWSDLIDLTGEDSEAQQEYEPNNVMRSKFVEIFKELDEVKDRLTALESAKSLKGGHSSPTKKSAAATLSSSFTNGIVSNGDASEVKMSGSPILTSSIPEANPTVAPSKVKSVFTPFFPSLQVMDFKLVCCQHRKPLINRN